MYQADNLRKKDLESLEKCFKDFIEPENPEARFQSGLSKLFQKKNCLFKEKCKDKRKPNA